MNYWYAENFEKESKNENISDLLMNGYTVVKNSLDTACIDKFLSDYEKVKFETLSKYANQLDREDCLNGMYRRLTNLHLKIESALELFSKNSALEVTDYFFGESTTLYTSLFFERGSAQECHRDTPYFWTYPGYGYFGVWLALEDINPNSGPLMVIPKSHKIIDTDLFRKSIGDLERADKGLLNPQSEFLWLRYQSEIQKKCNEGMLRAENITINKGDTIIWHPQLMHGGSKILDDSLSRKSFVMHVTPRGMNVFGQEKYFDPSVELQDFSRDLSIKYIKNNDRLIRQTGLWSIAHKIFLNI